jgi:protein phosphatase
VTGHDKIEHASLTDVGIRRSHNQDSHAVLLAGDEDHWNKQGHVFLVADGMGAHAVGELASELAATIIPLAFHKYAVEDAELALHKAFTEANASIYARGQQNREFQGMGTTGTVLVLRPEGAWVGHVGDSRAYRLRGGKIEQLSFDHSLVWELARRLKVKPEGLQGVPSNVIVRSLGPDSEVEVDVEGPHPLQDGDTFILCSDGLSGQVSDQEIGAVANALPPAEACQFLVDLANLRGGPDNITVVIVRVNGCPSGAAADADGGRKPLYSWAHWPFGALILGVMLAIGAVILSVDSARGAYIVFSLSALAILTGVGGLLLHSWKEKNAAPRPRSRPRLKTYSQTSYAVDRALIDKILRVDTLLSQLVRDRQWEADWETYENRRRLAEQALTQNDLTTAFRELCRAIFPLTEVVHRQRHKEEVFQPLWDKMQTGEKKA